MVGVMVSSSAGAMSSLLTKLTILLGTEYQKHKRMQKEVALLKDELSTMNALLEMLEDIDELDPLTREWRNQVRKAAYDIEDCVNNFIHSPTNNKAKVGFIQEIIQRFKSLRVRSKFAKQFQELKAQVVEVSNRRDRYKHDDYASMSSYVAIDPRVSALYTDAASLVGINGHVEELIKWLMDGNKKLKVVSILGIGGIGKTTLANQVYHKLDGQFDCKAFVSVSQKPDMKNLINNILLEFGEQRLCDSCDVRHRLNKIRKYLQSKRYFVIIDDLWDTSAWEVIKCAFPENHHQSRVITMTRIRSVAAACCNNNCEDIYNMKALTDQDTRRLFFNRIFGSGGTCPPHFKSVSTEILKKCGGMALAIITIASLLASQPNNLKEQWEYIRNSLGTSHGENPTLDRMRKILNLSYKNLPHCLKACFLYVGIYPEDYTIKKDDLIKLWVAEGFVRTTHNDHGAYCVARGYFNELINRSMIQPILLDHNDEVLTCRVHDMILDLIISKSTDENLFTIVNDSKFMRRLSGKVRRLSFHSWITVEKYNKTVATICLSQVRSLVMLSYGCIPNVLDFRGLQVLILENSDQQDLTGICTLTQLRYFKIRTMGQFKLPTQIRGLQHLETIEIEKVPHFWFESPDNSDIIVPSDIIHLPRLLHLIIPDQTIMPDGIDNLKSLQTLKYFDLGKNSLHNIESLQELTNLKDLHLSCSRGSSFVGYKDILFPSLARLAECNLKNLSINHHLSTMCCDNLNGLFKSAHHLQRLCLLDWQFSRVPSWMGELNVLHSLELSLGKLLEDDVLILAEMPSLAHLHLHVRSSPKERIVISGTAFIVLKHFRLICKTIPLTFEAGAMPKLQILELEFNARGMERQMELPVGIGHLSSLKQIHASIDGFRATQLDRTAAEFVFNNVMCIHPNHPCVDIKYEPYKFIDWDDEDEYM